MSLAFPLLLPTSTIWEEHTKLLVGNCFLDGPLCHTLVPKEQGSEGAAWLEIVLSEPPHTKSFERLPGYSDFKLKNKHRLSKIFGLWDGGVTKEGVLYCIESKTYTELAQFKLPFSITAGTLTLSDAYYEKAWHSILVLIAQERGGKRNLILAFDISDSTKPLVPFINYVTDELMIGAGKPAIVRLKNGHFGIAISGTLLNKGVLQILWLDKLKEPFRFFVLDKHLSALTAVDVMQQGFVDRIYVMNKAHLWVLNFTHFPKVGAEKIIDAEILYPPIVIPNGESSGVRIYFLGNILNTKGFFMVLDPLEAEKTSYAATLIMPGDFISAFIRFGHFFLVSKDLRQKPYVMRLSDHESMPIAWQTFYSNLSIDHPGMDSSERAVAKWIWEPKEEKDMLLILNSSCQLNILVGNISNSKYKRMLWRKLPIE